jgi:hypothetical protein
VGKHLDQSGTCRAWVDQVVDAKPFDGLHRADMASHLVDDFLPPPHGGEPALLSTISC